MSTILIDKTQDGFVVIYINGINVKWAHDLIGSKNQSELVKMLSGEGVREIDIQKPLAVLEKQRSTTVTFPPKM